MGYSDTNRLSRNWDRQLEDGLPDCRVAGPRNRATTFQRGMMTFERIFCANCGKAGGAVTETTTHVFFVCDVCVGVLGSPPGCLEVLPPSGYRP